MKKENAASEKWKLYLIGTWHKLANLHTNGYFDILFATLIISSNCASWELQTIQ